jgi:hypothetical protein
MSQIIMSELINWGTVDVPIYSKDGRWKITNKKVISLDILTNEIFKVGDKCNGFTVKEVLEQRQAKGNLAKYWQRLKV